MLKLGMERKKLHNEVFLKKANVAGHLYCTALVWAAGRGATDIVHALLERGAKTEIADKFGTTPLIWASRAGHARTGQQANTCPFFFFFLLLQHITLLLQSNFLLCRNVPVQ
jgi:ankyrin repeat protein